MSVMALGLGGERRGEVVLGGCRWGDGRAWGLDWADERIDSGRGSV